MAFAVVALLANFTAISYLVQAVSPEQADAYVSFLKMAVAVGVMFGVLAGTAVLLLGRQRDVRIEAATFANPSTDNTTTEKG